VVSIGLDVGTGFVKCVSDYGSVIFPSLFAYRDMGKWEESQGRIEAVGKNAREFSKYPDAVIIRPVSEGRPIDERGFEALVTEAVRRVCSIGLQQSTFAKHRQEIRKNVVKLSDILSNKLINFMSQLDNKNHYDIIVSGGGIMIPEMKESLERKIQRKIEIPKIPIMSNAIGLYKLAANK